MTLKTLLNWLQKYTWLVWFVLVAIFIWSRWFGLTNLPVFADEAIYIRWSQLLRQGPEYRFFAMNDGKPPLFIWTLFPWLELFQDPLWAARSWSAVVGCLQLGVIVGVLRTWKAPRLAWFLGAALVLLLPFWVLHHRLALMDGLLVLGLSTAFWGLTQIDIQTALKKPASEIWKPLLGAVLLAGGGWGVALLSKTPALFFAPVFALMAIWGESWDFTAVWRKKNQWNVATTRLTTFGIAGALGLSIFLILRIHPAFGSLFSRGADFSYTLSEWFAMSGEPAWRNLQRVIPWLAAYLRPELFTFAAASLIFSAQRRKHALLWLCGLIAIAPLLLLGKTLHPRYFLPIVPFITWSAALFATEIITWLQDGWRNKMNEILVAGAIATIFVISSLRFMLLLQFSPHLTPFVPADREQYLTSWAAGYGIPQVRDQLLARSRAGERTTVVTEGSFGTLPDGLLLYFDKAPEIKNLRIEGLAQYPVKILPDWVLAQAKVEETWLIVNEDRFQLQPEFQTRIEIIGKTPKPYGAPALLVVKILPL